MATPPGTARERAAPVPIAFCITDLDPGGAERALVHLVVRLDRRAWTPAVFCLGGPGALVEELKQSDVPVTCLGARDARHISALPRLVGALRRFRPVLVQTFLFHANIAGRIAARLAGVRRVVSGIRVAEKRSRWPLWLDRATDCLVDRHVCVSRDVAEFSRRRARLPPRKIAVIPNGVDVDRFAHAGPADLSPFGIPPGSRTVIAVGRLDPQKAPFDLLQASEPLLAAFPDLHLLFVGDGPLREAMQAWIGVRRLVRRIHLAGWRSDVPELLQAADVLALASRWEGLPNVLLEATAAGRPVVATDVEGVRDVVRDGETGTVVPPGSPEALSQAIQALLADTALAAAMGSRAQQHAIEHLTWEAMAARYEELYRTLLGY